MEDINVNYISNGVIIFELDIDLMKLVNLINLDEKVELEDLIDLIGLKLGIVGFLLIDYVLSF